MSRLLTLESAQSNLGIAKPAMIAAIERGDLTQVELESVRGKTKKYVTAESVDAWIDRINGRGNDDDSSSERTVEDSLLYFLINDLVTKVQQAIGRMDNRQERDRRTRLRHTVSSKIGDSFDPHGYYVYLLWGDDDETPLYIGQSRNVLSRLGTHMQTPDKRSVVTSVQLIKCSGHSTMCRTEAALIREYKPPMNTVGVR